MKNKIIISFTLLLSLVYIFFSEAIDLKFSRFFFKMGNSESFLNFPWMNAFFHLGPWPAILFAFFALILFVFSFFIIKLKPYRKELFYLWLTFALGIGLVAHGFFKEFWGRPRPKHLIEFGGNEEYRKFYNPGPTQKGEEHFRSFPCGHCTTGFYCFAFVFLFKIRKQKRLSQMAFIFSLLYGGSLGILRIAQGGHFFSDVMAGGLLMWFTAWIFFKWIFDNPPKTNFLKLLQS